MKGSQMSVIYYNDEDYFDCNIQIMEDIVEITMDYHGQSVTEYYTLEEYNEMVSAKVIFINGGCNTVNA